MFYLFCSPLQVEGFLRSASIWFTVKERDLRRNGWQGVVSPRIPGYTGPAGLPFYVTGAWWLLSCTDR
jgi:hypothetical protein